MSTDPGPRTRTASHSRFAFLDGMRGVAALLVVTRHTHPYWTTEFYRSYLAVDLFFILSGFVIAHAYDDDLRLGRMSFADFAATRLIRLYPIFVLSVIAAACALIAHYFYFGAHTDATAWSLALTILFALAFLPSHFIPGDYHMFVLNWPYWSLFFELLANAIYAAIHRILSVKVLTAIIVLSLLYVARSAIKQGKFDLGFMWNIRFFILGLLRTTLGFFMGVALYRMRPLLAKSILRYLSPWFGLLIVVVVLGSRSLGAANPYIDIFAVVVLFPLAVLSGAEGAPTRFNRTLLTLGAASYPIYVLHLPVGVFLHDALGARIERCAPWSGVLLLVFLLCLSLLLEKYYDIPIRRRLRAAERRWLTPRRAAEAHLGAGAVKPYSPHRS